jgi:hypothetical protein
VIEQRKQAWFEKHRCFRSSYIGHKDRVTRIYTCDDGREYVWDDIPQLKEG